MPPPMTSPPGASAAPLGEEALPPADPPPPSGGGRVMRNTAAGALGKLVTMVLGFAVTPTLLASLGQEQFGLYAIVMSLQGYFGVLDLGIGGALARFMIGSQERGDRLGVARITAFGVAFYAVMALLLAPAVYALAPVVIGWLRVRPALAGEGVAALWAVFALFIASAATGVISARLYAAHRMDLTTLSGVSANAVFIASVLIFVPRHPSIYTAMACSAAQLATGFLLNLVFLRRIRAGLLIGDPRRLPRALVRSLFSFGVWSQVNSVTAIVNLEADKLIIGRMLGTAQVAPYQVGNRYALLSRALPLQLLGALFPDVTARIARGLGPDEMEALYRQALRSLMLATLTVVGFLVAVTPMFLRAWIGRPLPGADAIAIALMLSYAVNNLTGVGTTIVRAEGRPEIETIYAVASAVLNIGATLVLTPIYGLWGVVGGTIFGNVVGSIGFMAIFHRRSRFPFGATVLSWLAPLVAGVALAALATAFLNHALADVPTPGGRLGRLALIGATGPVYLAVLGVALGALRFWRPGDFDALSRGARKFGARLRPRAGGASA